MGLLLAVLAAAPAPEAQAVLGRAEAMTTNADAAYYYVRPGTASVRVQVLGAVRAPGLYEVSEGMELGQLLALTGGPTLGVSPSGTRAEASVQLHRARGQELAFEAPLEQLVGSAETPVLEDGDVLMVEVRAGRVESADTNASAFYYVRPGTPSVQAQVLGAVRAPGLYEVSEGMELGELLALAGGPALGTASDGARTTLTLRLHRKGSGEEIVYDGPIGEAGGTAFAPEVLDGDVLIIEVRSRRSFGWRDAVQIVSTVGVLALAIERLARAGG